MPVAKAGNGMWLEAHGGNIENLATKETDGSQQGARCLRGGRSV